MNRTDMAPKEVQSVKDRIAIFSSDDEVPDQDMPSVVRLGLNRKESVFRPRKHITKSEKLNNRKGFIKEKEESRRNLMGSWGQKGSPTSIRRPVVLPVTPEADTVVHDTETTLTGMPNLPHVVDSSALPPLSDRSKVFESSSATPGAKVRNFAPVKKKGIAPRSETETQPCTPNATLPPTKPPIKGSDVATQRKAKEQSILGVGVPPRAVMGPTRSSSFDTVARGPRRRPPLPRHSSSGAPARSNPEPSTLPSTPRRMIQRKSSFDSVTSKVSIIPENVFRRNPRRDKGPRKAPKFSRSDIEGELIRSALKESFVFKHMTDLQLKLLVTAFEKKQYAEGEVIVELGDNDTFFYVIQRGEVEIRDIDDDVVGSLGMGDTFGELALISSGRGDTAAVAVQQTVVLRVDQETVNYHLKQAAEDSEESRIAILKKIAFLKDLSGSDLKVLAAALKRRSFEKGEVILKKGGPASDFFIIKEGKVKLRDSRLGNAEYEPVSLGPGQYFGDHAIAAATPQAATVVSRSEGVAYTIDAGTFSKVLSKQFKQILKAQDPTKIAGVKAISYKQKPKLDSAQLTSLSAEVTNKIFKEGKRVVKAGKNTEPALYLVREGTIVISSDKGDREICDNGYFGFETCPVPTNPTFTATCKTVCILGVLTLSQMQEVFDTKYLEVPKEAEIEEEERPVVELKLEDIQRHQILGEGNFGQVWLSTERGKSVPYALKIQSKFELLEEGQAETVMREKDIMLQLRHPFISNLVQTFQDTDFLYMLLKYEQGGELFNVIHSDDYDFLPEESAKFYACAVADALAYMHRRFIAYRDLKPENIVLESSGYPVIIDFGYAKHVPENTFTLCGTPNYLSPEMITSRGHGCAVDDWALGVIVYECLTGSNPFFEEGMDQTTLYRSIVQDAFPDPADCTYAASDFINQLLEKDPNKRLGSTSTGVEGIFEHPWLMTIDLEALRAKKIKAPWVPELKDALDASNFDDWSDITDKTQQAYPLLLSKDQAEFEGF